MDMGATNLGCAVLALLALVARTVAQEAILAGPVGAGREIQFTYAARRKGLITHSGGLDYGLFGNDFIYTGGNPGCCERCRKQFEKDECFDQGGCYNRAPQVWSNDKVWGRTDMYNFKWDNKYNFNSCTCYAGPSDPEKLAQIGVENNGPVAGYCGNDTSFADITFGEDMTFYFESVTNLGRISDLYRHLGSSDKCCEKCKNKFPGTEFFKFDKFGTSCDCYKSIPGKRPETYGEGYYAGICTN